MNPEHQKSNFSKGYAGDGKKDTTGYNKGKFDSRPKISTKATSVNLFTNQYKLVLGQELSVFQYEVIVTPDTMHDAYITHGIFRQIKRKVESLLGLYVISGNSLFTTTDLTDSLLIEATFQNEKYEVLISVDSKKYLSGKQLTQSKMEDHNILHTLVNIIIKQAFRDTSLRQIGRQPRFFDMSKAIDVPGSGLQACPGFRASAFNYASGMTLVIDNINKFLSNKSCLERIQEILNGEGDTKDKQERVIHEFRFKSVIGTWANKKTYIVENVIFDKNPVTSFFIDNNGDKQSIAGYFSKTYKMKVKVFNQPLFQVKINGKDCHIPTEFCTIDGVPETIREDP